MPAAGALVFCDDYWAKSAAKELQLQFIDTLSEKEREPERERGSERGSASNYVSRSLGVHNRYDLDRHRHHHEANTPTASCLNCTQGGGIFWQAKADCGGEKGVVD